MSGSPLRAGVVGLGMIGGGVAVSLARSGRVPAVFDVRPDATAGLDGVPAQLTSAALVAASSDVVLVAVVNADQLRAVLTGPDGVLAAAHPGLTVVVLSTVDLPVIEEMARACADAGATLLDCGVTPGDKAADNGMVAMVGGPDDGIARAMPVLDDFARAVVHCGPLGAGMATKIARNVITYGTWAVVAEASALAEASGVALSTFLEVLQAADADGGMQLIQLQARAAAIDIPPDMVERVSGLADKDLAAAQQLGSDRAVPVPIVDAARPRMRTLFTGDESPGSNPTP